jgi:hypothetical protein
LKKGVCDPQVGFYSGLALALETGSEVNSNESCFELLQALRGYQFTLKLRALDRIELLPWNGSTFKGVFGHQLKSLYCVNPRVVDCKKSPCLLSSQCLYHHIMVSPLPYGSRFLENSSNIPPPLIIIPPDPNKDSFDTGEYFETSIVVIGWLINYLPSLIYTFISMGQAGVGWKNKLDGVGHFDVVEVQDTIGKNRIYSDKKPNEIARNFKAFDLNSALQSHEIPESVSLNTITPIRISEKINSSRKAIGKFSSFGQIIYHLYWRLIILSYFHSNPWDISDERFNNITEQANQIRELLAERANTEVKMTTAGPASWRKNPRHSNYNPQNNKLGGFMGGYVLTGNLAPYLPMLYLGEYTHIGKQTLFGLGKYQIIDSK